MLLSKCGRALKARSDLLPQYAPLLADSGRVLSELSAEGCFYQEDGLKR